MKPSRFDPGLVVSSAAHAALLAVALVGFASAKKFEDAQESVPVEVVTQAQLNEIMKGEKSAKDVKAAPRAQKVAEVVEAKPETPTPEAKADAPGAAPPQPKELPDPGKDDVPEPPKREPVAAAPPEPPLPPVRPVEPPKPKAPPPPPPKAEAKPPPDEDKPDAEVIAPKPQPRPAPAKVAEVPEPPKKVRPVTAPPEPPKPPVLKPDALAKFIDQKKAEEAAKPAPAPKAAPPAERAPLDPKAIQAIINKDRPQARPPVAPDPVRTASLGTPNGGAARMSPALLSQLGSLMTEHFNQCWSKFGLDLNQRYVAQIKVRFRPDGSFMAEPLLLNAPSDPKARSIADSALRAVKGCPPLIMPQALVPFYAEWKDGLLRMDPNEL